MTLSNDDVSISRDDVLNLADRIRNSLMLHTRGTKTTSRKGELENPWKTMSQKANDRSGKMTTYTLLPAITQTSSGTPEAHTTTQKDQCVAEARPSFSVVHSCDVLGPKVCTVCREEALSRLRWSTRLQSSSLPSFLQSDASPRMKLLNLHAAKIELFPGSRVKSPGTFTSIMKRRQKLIEQPHVHSVNSEDMTDKGKNRAGGDNLFFVDMDDLRDKIYTGKIPRIREKTPERGSLMLSLNQPFVSSKSSGLDDTSSNCEVQCFSPPLLPVHCQNTEPSFFAGDTDVQYKLPKRLRINEDFQRAVAGFQLSELLFE